MGEKKAIMLLDVETEIEKHKFHWSKYLDRWNSVEFVLVRMLNGEESRDCLESWGFNILVYCG